MNDVDVILATVSGSRYDVAEVCLNGHVTNNATLTFPHQNQPYCDECGARTIRACLRCQTPIRGYYWVPGVIGVFDYSPPAYCFQCGEPMPWTAARLEAAKALASDLEELTPAEQDQLTATLEHLIADTPMTTVSAGRFKRLITKAGKGAAEAFHDILVDVVSETARKAIWGS